MRPSIQSLTQGEADMGTVATTRPAEKSSPRSRARIAGVFYLLTFVTGGAALVLRGGWDAAVGLSAGVCYVAVTLLFYDLFKPVSKGLSLLAAGLSLTGVAMGALAPLHLVPFRIHSFVFFGFYCLLIGYLIIKSNYLPSVLGALMVFAGLGWLTYLSPALASRLFPYVLAPGLLGEGALTLWLLVKGVDETRWNEQVREQRA
jgi:hypothetical protein